MKRLNPITNKEFKFGDVRKDGYIFYGYKKSKNSQGLYGEEWMSEATLERRRRLDIEAKRKRRTTPEGRAKVLLTGANRRGKANITWEWIAEKINKGHCELTGLPFDLSPSEDTYQNPYAPSLDRIDAKNRLYSFTNTRVVLAAVNAALGEHGQQKMLPILEAMVKVLKGQKK